MKFILVLLVFVIVNLQASQNEVSQSNILLNASVFGYNMDYREYDDNSKILDSEKSDFTQMMGVDFSIAYAPKAESWKVSASVEFIGGDTDYVGSYIGSEQGYGSVQSTTTNSIVDFHIDYSATRNISKDTAYFYGASLGHREWTRTLSEHQEEVYYWSYIEPKLGFKYLLSSSDIVLETGYKVGIDPSLKATGVDETFKLSSEATFKVSAKYSMQMSSKSRLFFAYEYQNQVIKKSNVVYASDGNGYLEPDSISKNQYIKIGAEFKY